MIQAINNKKYQSFPNIMIKFGGRKFLTVLLDEKSWGQNRGQKLVRKERPNLQEI